MRVIGMYKKGLLGHGGAAPDFDPSLVPGYLMDLDARKGLTLSVTGYAGTGTITQSGNIVTGSSTQFLREIFVGDTLTATGISGTVIAIGSATSLTAMQSSGESMNLRRSVEIIVSPSMTSAGPVTRPRVSQMACPRPFGSGCST